MRAQKLNWEYDDSCWSITAVTFVIMQRPVDVRLNPYAQCVKHALKRCLVFRCCCCCGCGGGGGVLF